MDSSLEAIATRATQRLLASGIDAGLVDRTRHAIGEVAIASDFAIATLAQQPALLARMADAQSTPRPLLDRESRGDWPALLRRYRAGASARLVWREVLGLDDVGATLACRA